ncbi:hypothetical protein [Lactococcus formosensis]|uniref:hypothetical protein n=1 Tax=Lactococcus formosensis TaxID=1281486 RepID=UPI002435FF9A|nr:hypothetical protein [Lactococcus formosensis]MDG6113790.1 hypothetical protein [Lactococcus formosensis]MDG6122219.1 hypothetical protein [Lactococcus formosensis]MDG6151825.1 hypothetical protein [Lactococcus formosensis]MDG6174955.1 hypothetical protein [Lactococcus formosensis]MDG6181273.1 hypothetical protein [Lactococcus formosensis]
MEFIASVSVSIIISVIISIKSLKFHKKLTEDLLRDQMKEMKSVTIKEIRKGLR